MEVTAQPACPASPSIPITSWAMTTYFAKPYAQQSYISFGYSTVCHLWTRLVSDVRNGPTYLFGTPLSTTCGHSRIGMVA